MLTCLRLVDFFYSARKVQRITSQDECGNKNNNLCIQLNLYANIVAEAAAATAAAAAAAVVGLVVVVIVVVVRVAVVVLALSVI